MNVKFAKQRVTFQDAMLSPESLVYVEQIHGKSQNINRQDSMSFEEPSILSSNSQPQIKTIKMRYRNRFINTLANLF